MLKRLTIAALVAVMAVPMFVTPASSAATEATEVNVRAVDYELKGIPAELKVGAHKFTLQNKSDENFHELIVFRKRAWSDKSWEELLSMPQKEAEKHVVFVGATGAEPGKDGKPFRAYLKAGKYLAACFVQNDKNSKPHAYKGMIRKFHVAK